MADDTTFYTGLANRALRQHENNTRAATAAEWAAANPILRRGEVGEVLDTGEMRVGDGITPWSSLIGPGGSYAPIKGSFFYPSGPHVPTPQKNPGFSYAAPGTTFASGHGWTNAGTGGAWNLNDTSDYVMGSQCVSVLTDGSNGTQWVQKLNQSAVDLTSKDLVLWVKVADITKLRTLRILLSSDNLVNYYTVTLFDFTYGLPPSGIFRSGDWFQLRFNLASDNMGTTGTPNKAAITGFRIAPSDISGGGGTTVKFGGIGVYDRNTAYPNGVVTFGFDDSFISHRTIAAPYLAKYGWAGTAYTICDAVSGSGISGGSGYGMTVAQLQELRDLYGWDLAAHAFSVTNHGIGFPNLSASVLSDEISQMVNWLQYNGLSSAAHFAWPRGLHSAGAEAVIRRYFSTARALQVLPYEVVQPGAPLRSRALQISAGGAAIATAAIDKAYTNGSWLQLVHHDILSSGATGNQLNAADFQTIVDYCNTKGIPVAPVSEVWRKSV